MLAWSLIDLHATLTYSNTSRLIKLAQFCSSTAYSKCVPNTPVQLDSFANRFLYLPRCVCVCLCTQLKLAGIYPWLKCEPRANYVACDESSRALRLLQQPGELNPAQCKASTQPRLYFCRVSPVQKSLSCLCPHNGGRKMSQLGDLLDSSTVPVKRIHSKWHQDASLLYYFFFYFLHPRQLRISWNLRCVVSQSSSLSVQTMCRVVKLSYVAHYFKLRLFPTWGEIKPTGTYVKKRKHGSSKSFQYRLCVTVLVR